MNTKRNAALILAILIVGTLGFMALVTAPAQAGFFNCKIVSCAAPACLEGEHLHVPPGQCCPVCVPD
jgi:hypothetical protein